MPPLISIIIPIYNVEHYLHRCVDSVIKQTYTNIEIILVDDGSPDNCPHICDEYASKDNRIIVIHKENGGLSDARNAGLESCTGEYVSFVDSDDWIHERYIEKLFQIIKKNNADIAISRFLKTDGTKSIPQTKEVFFTISPKEAIINCTTGSKPEFVISCSKLYKRNLFEGVRFPPKKYHEDEFTTYILFYKAQRIAYTSQYLYYYFTRTNSITASQHPYDALEAFEQRYLFFKEKKETMLLPHLLPSLCWHYLYCSFIENQNGNKQKADKFFFALKKYLTEPSFNKVHLFHKFSLRLFATFPGLYNFYRKHSPILLRKKLTSPN